MKPITQEEADQMVQELNYSDYVEDYEENELGHVYTLTHGESLVVSPDGTVYMINENVEAEQGFAKVLLAQVVDMLALQIVEAEGLTIIDKQEALDLNDRKMFIYKLYDGTYIYFIVGDAHLVIKRAYGKDDFTVETLNCSSLLLGVTKDDPDAAVVVVEPSGKVKMYTSSDADRHGLGTKIIKHLSEELKETF